jgi:hypothetical protein
MEKLIGMIVVVGIIFAIIFFATECNDDSTDQSGDVINDKTPSVPVQIFPKSGTVNVFKQSQVTVPLSISVPSGNNNVFVILKGLNNNWVKILEVYISAGSTVNIDVPLFSDVTQYRLYSASGEKWYGKELFFNNNNFSHTENMEFKQGYSHTVELIPQVNGNLSETTASIEDFQ